LPDWRQAPLRCLNRILAALAILMTIAAPCYLWYDRVTLAARMLISKPESSSSPLSKTFGAVADLWKGARREQAQTEAPSSSEEEPEEIAPQLEDEWGQEPPQPASEEEESSTEEAQNKSSEEIADAQPLASQSVEPERSLQNAGSASAFAVRRNFFAANGNESAEPAISSLDETSSQQYSLLGVMMGERPRAIVRDNFANVSKVVAAGQSLGAYRVREILPNRVVLESNGACIELKM
jgi:hypothetical protein